MEEPLRTGSDPTPLSISERDLEIVIQLAREFDVQVAPASDEDGAEDDGQDHFLEARRSSPVARELRTFINGLNEDQQADLVTLMWIGRGTFGADEWDEARETAFSERSHMTSRYLMGSPMLAENLEAGLESVGIRIDF